MKSFKLAGVKFIRYINDGSENPWDFDRYDFFPESSIYCLFHYYNSNKWSIKQINRIGFYHDKITPLHHMIYVCGHTFSLNYQLHSITFSSPEQSLKKILLLK